MRAGEGSRAPPPGGAARRGARNTVFQQVCLKMNGFNDVARLVPVSERNVR